MKMYNKIKRSKKKLDNILIIMISIYILGVIIGSFLIYIDKDSSNFLITILKNSMAISISEEVSVFSSFQNLFNDIIFFLLICLLKYSGVLKILTSSIPLIYGMKNSILYSMASINGMNFIKILSSLTIKDTAISFLLILYSASVLNEIIKEKEDIKYDLKILLAYIIAVFSIYIIDVGLKMLILI